MTQHPWTTTYDRFSACYDASLPARSCGYTYAIQSHAMAHVAFRSAEDFMRWLHERGLRLVGTMPDEQHLTYKILRIEGSYIRASYLDVQAFREIQPLLKIAEMENGRYTLGKVTEEQGVRTVHYLNINVPERVEFDYAEVEAWGKGIQRVIAESPDTVRG